MPGLVINGKQVTIGGLEIDNFLDDPALRLGASDKRKRTTSERWVRLVVLHSSLGIPGGADTRPQTIKPGLGPGGNRAERLVRYWTGESRGAGAHLVVDFDGRVSCLADIATEATYHAGHANGPSVGIEICQGRDEAEIYSGQLDAAVKLCDALTGLLGIQRQIPERYVGPSPRLMASVDDVVGIVGHRDLTGRRGPGDPGSAIFYRLGAAGYELVNFDLGEDRELFRRRQRDLGVDPADGIAGPITRRALARAEKIRWLKGQRPLGLWVTRIGDELLPPV